MRKIAAPLLLALVFILGNSFFIVKEGQQAIVLRFGNPVGTSYVDAGLKFKLPFICCPKIPSNSNTVYRVTWL